MTKFRQNLVLDFGFKPKFGLKPTRKLKAVLTFGLNPRPPLKQKLISNLRSNLNFGFKLSLSYAINV